MRIQMYGAYIPAWLLLLASDFMSVDGLSSLTALIQALKDLDDLCVTIDEEYSKSLQNDQYERWDEKS